MEKRKVRAQVERLLDESGDTTLSIIVQGRTPHLSSAVANAAASAARTRSISAASDLLPEAYRRGAVRRSSQIERTASAVASLKSAGITAIEPIQKGTFINSSRLARRADQRGKPRPLALAGAAAMEIHRDDLAKLPVELPEALAVFANRRVPVPPKMKPRSVNQAIVGRSTHAWGLESSGALATWGAFEARGQGTRVAVLDTGVEPDHPDLHGKVLQFAEFDEQGNIVKKGIKHARDVDGHGTHVCGTIAGGRESGRWIGMAPEAKLLVGKVLGRNGGTDEQILQGIEWAIRSSAGVINLSLGGLSFEPGVLDTYTSMVLAARQAGIPVIAAIGNDGHQTSGNPGNDFFALAVGAHDVTDRVAAFSGGRTQIVRQSDVIPDRDLPLIFSKPDLAAPGVEVLSCAGKTKWDYASGTSMACPHVAGAAALLLSRTPAARGGAPLLELDGWERSERVIQLLVGSVVDLGENGQDHRFGHGRLCVLRAYSKAVELGYLPGA